LLLDSPVKSTSYDFSRALRLSKQDKKR
jgi:hypothetical protein